MTMVRGDAQAREATMTLREKAALAGLATALPVYGGWFAGWLSVSALLVILFHFGLLAIVQIVIAARHGNEAADERDTRIAQAAASAAFFVALGGIAFAVAMLSFGTPPARLALVLVAAFALADITRYGLQLILYRSE
ncbi:MAG TPA: hypothetical protein PKD99_13605 [Sphingopyxis sp.]|nr:hypothetical protein [Sphingopyxis sp.]HMP46131.1 hypothetical protein [Sphingopyxis sp.]HMQ19752.1 hypothetical protein [Sphingopyxis sp.]